VRMRVTRVPWFRFALLLPVFALHGWSLSGNQQEIPSVNGDVGTCSALFVVHDASKKPIYNAKIDVTIHYGFMNVRKTQLEVATNADGKARVTGLPNFPKKPLEFVVRSGTVSKTITDDPSSHCDAALDVTLAVR
jgi:hypothetical protein